MKEFFVPVRKKQKRRDLGLPPGTLLPISDATPTKVTVFGYGPESFEEILPASIEELSAFADRWPVLWINVDGLSDLNWIEGLGRLFNLHPLAMEDVLNLHQRPKIESYNTSLFVVLRMMYMNHRLESEQLSVFLRDHVVITFQERPGDCLESIRERIRQKRGLVRTSGADYLLYAILDAVVDAYFPLLENNSERFDELEQLLMEKPTDELIYQIQSERRNLLAFRRAVWPLRDEINKVLRDKLDCFQEETLTYLRDCSDHAIQVMDLIEMHRELSAGLMDMYMTVMSNRMNEVMKVLTIFAAIFIPLTFIAGIYGMNFDPSASPWNMPELGSRYGYPAALLVMLVVALGMLFFFFRKGWIGRKR
jgi:magnesium transporter